MSEYHKAKNRIEVSVGESVRILRQLQEMQSERPGGRDRYTAIHDFGHREWPRAPGCGSGQGAGQGAAVPSCCAGVPWPGRGSGVSRVATLLYQHPRSARPRTVIGKRPCSFAPVR